MRTHIRTWEDPNRPMYSAYPVCGQANTHSSVILAPGETNDGIDCKRCLKRWATQEGENRG